LAAEALEKSVLESKDKEQLLAIAQALGIKTTSRAAKATLIDKILESTGAVPAPSAPANGAGANGNGAAKGQLTLDAAAEAPVVEPPAAVEPPPPPVVDAPAAAVPAGEAPAAVEAASAEPEVVLGPDGEPLADWEVELIKVGDLPADGASAAPAPAPAGDRGGADDEGDDDEGEPGAEGESRSRRRRRRRNKNRGEGGDQPQQQRHDNGPRQGGGQQRDRERGGRAAARIEPLGEEGAQQRRAGPGDRQAVEGERGIARGPVVERRAGRGGQQRQREGAPGERGIVARPRTRAPQGPGADQREGQVAEHVGGVRNAEPAALVGEGVVRGPLRNRAVQQQAEREQRGERSEDAALVHGAHAAAARRTPASAGAWRPARRVRRYRAAPPPPRFPRCIGRGGAASMIAIHPAPAAMHHAIHPTHIAGLGGAAAGAPRCSVKRPPSRRFAGI